MYATVRQLNIKKSVQDKNAKLVHDELLPQLRAIPGFIDYYLVYTDKETEFAIGFFKDKKGADRSNDLALQFVQKYVAPDVTLKSISEGEVVVQSRTPAMA